MNNTLKNLGNISKDMFEYILDNNPMFLLSFKGMKSEFYQYKDLQNLSYISNVRGNSDNGDPDFSYRYKGKDITHEHKSIRNERYVNGDYKVEVQRTRSKNNQGTSSRLYEKGHFQILSVDLTPDIDEHKICLYISEHHLEEHKKHKGKINPYIRINLRDKKWKPTLEEALEDYFDWLRHGL